MDEDGRESVNPYQVTPACERTNRVPALDQGRTSTMAIVSLALGISSVGGLMSCALLLLLAPAAVVTGHIAHKQLREDPTLKGQGMATAGLITGYIGVGIMVLIVLVVIGLFLFEG